MDINDQTDFKLKGKARHVFAMLKLLAETEDYRQILGKDGKLLLWRQFWLARN